MKCIHLGIPRAVPSLPLPFPPPPPTKRLIQNRLMPSRASCGGGIILFSVNNKTNDPQKSSKNRQTSWQYSCTPVKYSLRSYKLKSNAFQCSFSSAYETKIIIFFFNGLVSVLKGLRLEKSSKK